jgi:protein TonB
VCHALLFGLGALLLTGPMGRPAAAENVEVALVEAKPDPIREVAPAPPERQPPPTIPATPRTSIARIHSKPQARAQTAAPEVAVSPSTEVATAGDVALPAAVETAPRKAEGISSSNVSPTAPARSGPGPITVVATPRYRSNPRPDYPIVSRRRHEEGEARLTVTVSPDGRVLHVSLFKSSGYPLLDQAAVDAVRTWTFEPARASGIAVTSEVVVPVRYSLSQE